MSLFSSQNSSEQSCDRVLFHPLVFSKSGVLGTVNEAAPLTVAI